MLTATNGSVPLVRSSLLDAVPGLWHAFTTRQGGVGTGRFATFNLSASVGDDPAVVRSNRKRLAEAAGVEVRLIRMQRQVHGSDVIEIAGEPPGERFTGDGFITRARGIPLLIGVADCTPVLLAADDGSAVAVAHAGWRGAVAGIIGAVVGALHVRYGIPPDRLCAAVGPAIGACCFEVGEDVARRFDRRHVLSGAGQRPHVDLPGSVRADLIAAGVRPDRVDSANLCTRCRSDLFFSHRGSAGNTGRMVGMILRR